MDICTQMYVLHNRPMCVVCTIVEFSSICLFVLSALSSKVDLLQNVLKTTVALH